MKKAKKFLAAADPDKRVRRITFPFCEHEEKEKLP
jgi:hypothetical protein